MYEKGLRNQIKFSNLTVETSNIKKTTSIMQKVETGLSAWRRLVFVHSQRADGVPTNSERMTHCDVSNVISCSAGKKRYIKKQLTLLASTLYVGSCSAQYPAMELQASAVARNCLRILPQASQLKGVRSKLIDKSETRRP